ncbi:unnamed protein product [Lota lota]
MRTDVEEALSDVMKRTDVEEALSDIMKRTDVEEALSDVMKRTDVEEALSDVMKRADVEEALSDVMKRTDVDSEGASLLFLMRTCFPQDRPPALAQRHGVLGSWEELIKDFLIDRLIYSITC